MFFPDAGSRQWDAFTPAFAKLWKLDIASAYTYIGAVGETATGVFAAADFPPRSMREVVAYAKANVLRWSYTTVGESMKLNVVYTYRLEKPETDKAPAPKIELESPVHVIVTSNLPRVVG